ncbi:MAG: DUF2213 domain-containing protein, partial [Terriglobales bacterium]
CGYTCQLDEVQGSWQGQHYDAVQRHRRYNHLAQVEHGRHGPEERIRLDAMGAGSATQREDGMAADPTIKVRINDADYDVPDAVKKHVDKLRDDVDKLKDDARDAGRKHDDLKRDHDDLRARHDDLRGRHDSLSRQRDDDAKEIVKLKAERDSARKDAAEAVTLETQAAVLVPGIKLDGKAPDALRREVLAALKPDLKLDGKTDAEVKIAYEMAAPEALTIAESARLRGNGEGAGLRSDYVELDPVRKAAADAAFPRGSHQF